MKTSKIIKQTTIALLAAITMLCNACDKDNNPPETQKTPITLGTGTGKVPGPSVYAGEAQEPGSRASMPPEDFFRDGDVLWIDAYSIDGTGFIFSTDFDYRTPAGGTPYWEADLDPDYLIYLEDVYADGAPTHNFEASFGGAILYDQSTDEDFHQADWLAGTANLEFNADGKPVFNIPTLERANTLVQVTITQGTGWSSEAEFLADLDGYDVEFHTSYGIGITPNKPTAAPMYQAIYEPGSLPASGEILFILMHRTAGNAIACRYTLPPGATPPGAGMLLTVTAPYNNHNTGQFTEPTVSIKQWEQEGTNTELPGKL